MTTDVPVNVRRFWTALGAHDWATLSTTLSPDFVRIGVNGQDDELALGAQAYVAHVASVLGRTHHHHLQVRSLLAVPGGGVVFAQTVETIVANHGEPESTLRMLSRLEVDDVGRVAVLDMYWKTPKETPPSWVTDAPSPP